MGWRLADHDVGVGATEAEGADGSQSPATGRPIPGSTRRPDMLFNDDQIALRDVARRFARDKLKPVFDRKVAKNPLICPPKLACPNGS